jgi:hypothetical protein
MAGWKACPTCLDARPLVGRERVQVADDDVRAHPGRQRVPRSPIGGDDQVVRPQQLPDTLDIGTLSIGKDNRAHAYLTSCDTAPESNLSDTDEVGQAFQPAVHGLHGFYNLIRVHPR